MSYLDESEYDDRAGAGRAEDDRPRDPRGKDGRRASQPARPAWDAATYGTPDDMRRTRPPAGGTDAYRYPADPYRSEPSYPAEPYRSPDPTDRYRAADPSYSDSSYSDPPYSADPPYSSDTSYSSGSSYLASSSGAGSYAPPAEPWSPGRSSSADPYLGGTDAFSANMYAPEPYSERDPYGAGAHPADPFAVPNYATGESPAGPVEPSDGRPSRRSYEQRPEPPTRSADQYPGGDPGKGHRPPSGGRAGRNLPAAIGVGVGLGAIIVASLFVWRPAFLAVVVVAVGIAIWELVRAIRTTRANPPLIPLVAGGALMMGLAWWGHGDALTFGLMVTVLAAMVWRLADGAGHYGRDVTAATLVAVYVPFLAGFAVLLATPPDGDRRVLVMLAGVVLSDPGGYIAGVLFGRHAMAPKVSPKKSWEGLAGSLFATGLGGALLLHFLFHVSFGWGALFGLAVAVAAVVGDLGESMLKRDLGVKDMSNLLPGHGGLMDRLDSIVFAAPTAYLLLLVLAPPL
jgi:phosphatidate cytidylyltransferase